MPPGYIRSGDPINVKIEQIGALTNPVFDELP